MCLTELTFSSGRIKDDDCEGRKERRADERSADVERLIPDQLGGERILFPGKFNNERKDPERQKKKYMQ